MNLSRIKKDLVYIFLNGLVCYIPIWKIRKIIYKSFGMKIGNHTRIGINTKIISPHKIILGDYSVINEECYLDGRGGLNIGNNCSISIRTIIITASHDANSDMFAYYEKEVQIKDNVWIGANAVILDGSILNNYTIIGANAVVKTETVEKGIYVGNPLKLLKYRDINSKYHINYIAYFR